MKLLYLLSEDELSEAVVRRLLGECGVKSHVQPLRRNGFGYLRSRIKSWNELAHSFPVLLLTDLDSQPCAGTLIEEWFTGLRRHPDFVFRVAVKEVESWLLADQEGFARFLRVSTALLPRQPELVDDPKGEVMRLAGRSRSKEIQQGLQIRAGSGARQGPEYNLLLAGFVLREWNPGRARQGAPSLDRMMRRLSELGEWLG